MKTNRLAVWEMRQGIQKWVFYGSNDYRNYALSLEEKTFINETIGSNPAYIMSGWSRADTLHLFNFPFTVKGSCLADSSGECRSYEELETLIAEGIKTWKQYDEYQARQELENLKAQLRDREASLDRLRAAADIHDKNMAEILRDCALAYDINEGAGPGSRKRVREILSMHVYVCEGCGKAMCCCDDEN